MTITQAEIDDLRRKAAEALEVEEEWGPLIRGRCCGDCDIRYAFEDAANPERITRLLDAHKAQAERIETLEGALETSCDLTDALGAFLAEFEGRDEILLAELNERVIAVRRAALGETEEG